MYSFSVDYNVVGNSNIINIHQYLVKKTRYKVILGFIEKCLLDY